MFILLTCILRDIGFVSQVAFGGLDQMAIVFAQAASPETVVQARARIIAKALGKIVAIKECGICWPRRSYHTRTLTSKRRLFKGPPYGDRVRFSIKVSN